MNYKIHITQIAERDIEEASDYIDFTLMNPAAIDAMLDEIEEKVSALSAMPAKYALVKDRVLRVWKIRLIPIKNYLLFFMIKEKTVYIVRFLHERRDWVTILHEGISLK